MIVKQLIQELQKYPSQASVCYDEFHDQLEIYENKNWSSEPEIPNWEWRTYGKITLKEG